MAVVDGRNGQPAFKVAITVPEGRAWTQIASSARYRGDT
jgi:hypothetical protein